jgi:hypothetical protein
MAGMISDWPKLLQEAFRVPKPSDRIEVSDAHMEFECQYILFRYRRWGVA